MRLRSSAIAVALAIVSASAAAAQPATRRFEVALGVGWIGSASMSSLDAIETQADGAARPLFGFSRELTSAPAIDARVAVRLSAHLDAEATGSYARPKLRVTTANDVENAVAATADEQLQEFAIGGAASWFLARRDAASRTMPFVRGGVSYARQLHQGNTLADAGAIVDVGGGIEQVLRGREDAGKSIGLRIDAGARVRPQSFAVDGRTHASPVVGASLFVRF